VNGSVLGSPRLPGNASRCVNAEIIVSRIDQLIYWPPRAGRGETPLEL
jgi:hypothetical protein